MVSRVLANEIYCGNEKYPPIITETQYRVVEKFRQRKAQTYSTVLQPFRQDMQCGAAENAYTGGLKPNNGFAANVEYGQSLSQKRNCLMLLQ